MNKLYIILFASIIISSCNLNTASKIKDGGEKMQIGKTLFGKIDNQAVYLYTLTNKHGMVVKITNYGGIVTSILVPDNKGHFNDVVLGFDNLEGYLKNEPYFGAIVGRYANRIAKGKFTLDGHTYELPINNGPNHIHGGIKAFDKVIWDAQSFQNKKEVGIELQYLSTDGEEGYPGNLDVKVKYILTNENQLKINYIATADKPTPVNLTHHSYFNLSGAKGKDVLDHVLWIDAEQYVAVDETLIPTGELMDVSGPMDFRSPKKVGSQIAEVESGYDHTYVLNNKGDFAIIATLSDSLSGRFMEVYTSEPGVQFYSGNFLDGSLQGKNGITYQKYAGLCLETQHFPDSPNNPTFPGSILKPGEIYEQQTVYRFGIID